MIDSITRITLNLQETNTMVSIRAKRGDTGRKLLIHLSDGSIPYHISDECYATFTAKKPDGTKINDACTIENNVIEYEFTDQTCTAVGTMKAEIRLYGADDKMITSACFLVNVYDTVFRDGDEVGSETEMNTLDDLILRANAFLNETGKLLRWQGNWDSETEYEANDLVLHEEVLYVAEEAIAAGTMPGSEEVTAWVPIAGMGTGSGGEVVGIASVKQTTTTSASGGLNVVTVTLTDGTESRIQIRNGQPGAAIQGPQGPAGPMGPQGLRGFTGATGPQGPAGDDYVLTDADKAEIAEMAADLVEVPEHSSGNAEDGFSPIAKVEQTATGAIVSITDKTGTTTATITNGKDGADGQPGKDGKDGEPGKDGAEGKSAYQYAKEAGYTGTEAEFAEKLADNTPAVDSGVVNELIDTKLHSVTTYGAKGDGVTDDTAAFQTALAKNRVVNVPGGTYVLSDTLVIRENCCLELSQDTLLKFVQTTGNCIEMRGSATLRGNHGNIDVSGSFTGNVISVDTALDGVVHGSIPPYGNWTPLWQRQRFIHDVNITRTEGGFRGSLTGGHSGTALYVSANYGTKEDFNGSSTAPITVIWGMSVTGLRIGGAFDYGINIQNMDKTDSGYDNTNDPAWNHDMRIEAVIVGCETGVRVFNCNTAHLDVTIEPAPSINKVNGEYVKYAKNGIILEHSNHIDLSQSLVWDWNTNGTLVNKDAKNAHIALIGVCKGVILSDFLYHEHSGTDIRKLIYTDTPSNFDSLIILQEPFTRWFKPIDGVPYFFDGTGNRALMLRSDKFTAEQAEFIHEADGYYERIPNYTNVVADYENGYYINSSGTTSPLAGMVTTGFIPLDGKAAHTFRVGGDGIRWKTDLYADTNYCRMAFYDADKNLVDYVMPVGSMLGNDDNPNSSYPHFIEDDTVDSAIVTSSLTAGINHGAAYFRISAVGKGANLIITIDEKVEDKAIWHGEPRRLDESIHAVTDWNAAEGEVGYIKNKPASIGGTSAPADWNASEDEVGHVLNRTHYSEWVTMLEETTLTTYGDSVFYLPDCGNLEVGNTYRLTVDGATFECKAFLLNGLPAIGSMEYSETFDPSLPLPFIVFQEEGTIMGVYGDAAIGKNLVVSLDGEQVTKLPKKFYEDTYGNFFVDIFVDGETYTTDVTLVQLSKAVLDGQTVFARVFREQHEGAVLEERYPMTSINRINIDGFSYATSPVFCGFESTLMQKRRIALAPTGDSSDIGNMGYTVEFTNFN